MSVPSCMGQNPNLHLHGFPPSSSQCLSLSVKTSFFFFPPSLLPYLFFSLLLFLTKYEVLAYFLSTYYILGCVLCFSLT